MTPFEVVLQHYRFPEWLKPFKLQVDAINAQAVLPHSGLFLDTGTGKTFVGTATSLFKLITKRQPTVVIMPPILISQWATWLRTIRPTPSITEYRGSPAERKRLTLSSDFVLVGSQVFMRDRERFMQFYSGRPPHVLVDEATMVCSIESQTHDAIYDLARDTDRELMTGTPASFPMHAYGILKFTAPGTYRNYKAFEDEHVVARDYFDKPNEFKELPKLRYNLERNSARILFEDLYPDVEAPVYSHFEYDLDPKHYKLYETLAENQLLLLPDGAKIDATTASKITHALGQIVANWDYFSQDPKNISATFQHMEQKLGELMGGKLIVFVNYRMTIRHIVQHYGKKYGAVAINSEVSNRQKDENVKRFKEDPDCRLIAIQPRSGGYGLDGLQHVCNYCMFLEPCTIPRDVQQAVARIKRTGQTKRVMAYFPTARRTLQVRQFKALLSNDALANQVIRNKADLREMIFGR